MIDNEDARPNYGLKIFNYKAGSIYSKNIGTRKDYRRTEALFANSLFSEFLLKNGLKRYRFTKAHYYKNNNGEYISTEEKWVEAKEGESGNWTRDIICIDFDYGTESSEEEMNSLFKKMTAEELKKKKEKLDEEIKKTGDEENRKNLEKLKQLYEEELDQRKNNESESTRLKKHNEKIKSLENKINKLYLKLENPETYKESNTNLNYKISNDIYKEIKRAELQIKAENKNYEAYLDLIYNLTIDTKNNEKKYKKKKSRESLRIEYYVNGVEIYYPGEEKPIEYRFLYRSPGKAKNGSCLFIRKKFYDEARKFLRMGKAKFDGEENKIVELGAYQSLVTSNIVGKIKINPENILVINDVDVFFERNVVSVWKLMKKKLHQEVAKKKFECGQKNTLWDGQSLIDCSVFNKSRFFHPKKEKLNGFILLRNHFFKSAAFPADLKQFFKDWCNENGKDYETFAVKDYWGQKKLVKNIELITTENSLKFKKFGFDLKDFNYWCKQVNKLENEFGIVKTAHKSKLYPYTNMSYQMVNALKYDEKRLKKVTKCSKKFIKDLYDNNESVNENKFIKFLENKASSNNDYEVLVALCKHNPKFMFSSYFRGNRRKHIISDFKIDELKTGRILQNAENLVIAGNPYGMLLATVERKWNVEKNEFEWSPHDEMFEVQDNNEAIQCYTKRFSDNKELAEFRSPFNSRSNIGYMINKYPNEKITKYFPLFSKQIIAVNCIGTDFCVRNNGSDFDSDTILTLNQPEIVSMAKDYYKKYATIINDIPLKDEVKDTNETKTLKQLGSEYSEEFKNFEKPIPKPNRKQLLDLKYALVDNRLAQVRKAIGSASNYALLCLTYAQNDANESSEIEKYIAILSVLAQAAIDNAKREFAINISEEISSIKKGMKIEENGYPKFWEVVENRSEYYVKAKEKKEMKCPMDYIVSDKFSLPDGNLRKDDKSNRRPLIDEKDFIVPYTKKIPDKDRKTYDRIGEKIKMYVDTWKSFHGIDKDEEEADNYALLNMDYDDMLNNIREKDIDMESLSGYLIDKAFYKEDKTYSKSMLLKTLYRLNKKSLLKCFKTEEDMKDVINKWRGKK